MRVIAGKARRLPLKTIEGTDTRPTTDRIKETLFNILQDEIWDCSFLDLFAGSGGIGIEALSRGAKSCVFVEKARTACACIQENLRFTKLAGEQAVVMECDCLNAISRLSYTNRYFDIVYMDPPYSMQFEEPLLRAMRDLKIIDENTLIIIEADLQTDFGYLGEIGYTLVREKRYKTNKHIFVRKNTAAATMDNEGI